MSEAGGSDAVNEAFRDRDKYIRKLKARISLLEAVAEAAEAVLWDTIASPPDHIKLEDTLRAAGYLKEQRE